jgi:CheY-like chemotaxis protein
MRQKLLIADDNRAITEVLKLNFDLLGYEVLVAVDGEDAEKKFKTFKPDLMILDVMMPKKNGYAVCRDLKRDPEMVFTPIILLTAKNLKEDVYWGYDCGADAYLTKPYDPRQLELLVDQLIRERAEGRKTSAWTGLPHAARILAEHKARLEAGAPSRILGVAYAGEDTEAFGRAYGQAALKDLIHKAAWKLSEACQRVAPTAVVGQRDDEVFVIVCNPAEAEAIRSVSEGALADASDAVTAGREPESGPPPTPRCMWVNVEAGND